MTKTDHVTIELPAVSKNPPVKYCKVKNQRPSVTKFELKPKYMPFLSDFVKEVNWNCAEKKITIAIEETPRFEAFEWFSTINKRNAEAQKSPFADLEQNSMILVMKDSCDKEVKTVKFSNIGLIDHNCFLGEANSWGASASDFVRHTITLSYYDCEVINNKEESFDLSVNDDNEIADEEWQSVEVS